MGCHLSVTNSPGSACSRFTHIFTCPLPVFFLSGEMVKTNVILSDKYILLEAHLVSFAFPQQ